MASSNSGTLPKCPLLPPAPRLVGGLAGQTACKADLRDVSHHDDGAKQSFTHSQMLPMPCNLTPSRGGDGTSRVLPQERDGAAARGGMCPWREGAQGKEIPLRMRLLLRGPLCECQSCFCSQGQRWCEETPAQRPCTSTYNTFSQEPNSLQKGL